jgi:hypothetical protein
MAPPCSSTPALWAKRDRVEQLAAPDARRFRMNAAECLLAAKTPGIRFAA